MKPETSEFLIKTLEQFSKINKSEILELYKMYSALEIDEYEKIIESSKEFFDFLEGHKNYRDFKQFQSAVDSARNTLMPKITKLAVSSFEKKFAETVIELLPNQGRNTKILDVGPGEMPTSALVFGKQMKKASAMDKEFIFAIESLKKLNVDAFEQYFDENTSVENYDIVVGRCACSAIPHIVKQCKDHNKAYFLELCDCELPKRKIEIKKPFVKKEGFNEKYTWKEALPEIDPSVKFYDNYAFNLDASPEQVKTIVDKIHGSILTIDKFKVPATTFFWDGPVSISNAKTDSEWKKGPQNDEEPFGFDWD